MKISQKGKVRIMNQDRSSPINVANLTSLIYILYYKCFIQASWDGTNPAKVITITGEISPRCSGLSTKLILSSIINPSISMKRIQRPAEDI